MGTSERNVSTASATPRPIKDSHERICFPKSGTVRESVVFIIGQRWISESEPELGLATVVKAASGRVEVDFKAAGETRTYAADHAPLKRVRFRVGEKVRTQADREFIIKEVVERQGLLTY